MGRSIAAIVCAAAFYAVSGIWVPFRPRGWDYLWHFGAWTMRVPAYRPAPSPRVRRSK